MEQRIKAYKAALERIRMAKQELDDVKKELGFVIRKSREKKGLKQIDMARLLKVSAPFLYDIELGRRSISIEMVEKIRKICSE